jgi:hypothetical protein
MTDQDISTDTQPAKEPSALPTLQQEIDDFAIHYPQVAELLRKAAKYFPSVAN